MKIAVLGTGRMGRWLATELAAQNQVAVFDRNPTQAQGIPGVQVFDSASELQNFAPELFANCVDIKSTVAAFQSVEAILPPDCMLCDIASIKEDVAAYYQSASRPFVSIHPMFGPTFSKLDALREENGVIINESDSRGIGFFVDLFARLGVRTFQMSFAEHDKMMAYSLGTPFISSLIFASCLERKAVPGSTFARHLKIAQGLLSEDNSLISEVLFQKHALEQIEQITSRLEFLKHVIRGRDEEEFARLLEKLRSQVR